MKKERIEFLETEIKRHNKLFWEEHDPEIPDQDYDALVVELTALDPANEILSEVHSTVEGREKLKHDIPMLSLDKVYSPEELISWARKVARTPDEKFYLMTKYDGLSAESNPGLLITRGNGEFGFDISDRIPYVQNLPEETGIRGEIVVLKSDFMEKRPCRSNGEPYKTARSAASGLINNQEPIAKDVLTFVPFTMGAEVVNLKALIDSDWDALIKKVQESNYPADGMVLSLLDKDYGDSLGMTGHHPRHSMSLKFKNPSAVTKVIDIRWTPGKHKLTPTAILEPVEISGFINSKASLHNMDQITKLGLHIGDTVEVQRCGDIIPQVVRVVKKGRKCEDPKLSYCPICAAPVAYVKPDLICTNKLCSGVAGKNLYDSIKRLGIEDIGPGTVNSLITYSTRTIFDLFNMTVSEWLELPGFAEASANAAYANVEKVRDSPIEDYKVLASLNIPEIGLSVSRKLLENNTLTELKQRTTTGLEKLPGIGSVMAYYLFDGLQSFELTKLQAILDVVDTKGVAAKPLVCFTGSSKTKRDEWIKIAEGKGMLFHNSVTKKLSLLVCADVESKSTKAKKARKYGVEIMSYDDFMNYEI